MARIVGGIAASHTPTIGFAYDKDKRDDPVWKPIFENFAPLANWLAEKRPDVVVVIYNDHISSFFFDHYSAFALGVGAQWRVADEGAGARDLPPIDGHPALASHIAQSLMADEFDMSFFQDKALDHGCFSPLSVLCPHEPNWPVKLVPLQMGVLQFPIPSARRFFKLGQALRRAIESYPEDLRVALIGTGGLSHQVHGERAGFNNPEWDSRDGEANPDAVKRHREHIVRELKGIEHLEGTYPFTLERSVKAYRINDYLHRMVEPAHREAFRRDPEASFEAAGLTEEERDLIRRRDWRGMMHYGVIFFMLEKLGAVVGVSNLHIYAAMRGQSLEDFQKTRNAPGALYSVAGKEGGRLAWDKSAAASRT